MNYSSGVIILLGSRNDEQGNLFPNAKKRADKAVQVFHKLCGKYAVLTTGGYGERFNTADRPHAFYLKEYMVSKGVPADAFLPFAESVNTIDDAQKAKPILTARGIQNIIVVTSHYHRIRSALIFRRVFGKGYKVTMATTPSIYSFSRELKFWYHEIRQTIRILLGLIQF